MIRLLEADREEAIHKLNFYRAQRVAVAGGAPTKAAQALEKWVTLYEERIALIDKQIQRTKNAQEKARLAALNPPAPPAAGLTTALKTRSKTSTQRASKKKRG